MSLFKIAPPGGNSEQYRKMIEFVKTLPACMAFIAMKLAYSNPALGLASVFSIVLTQILEKTVIGNVQVSYKKPQKVSLVLT